LARVVLNHPGFAGDSTSWEGWGHVEEIGELPEGAAGTCCAAGGGEVRPEHASEWAAIESVATKLGIGSAQTVHNWVRKAEVDAGTRPGTTSVESAEMRKLRSENRELRRANEILKLASAFFAAELDRPQR
jgi:transposase